MAKASGSESSTKENGADRGQRHGAREVHESYIRGWPVQAASVIRRDDSHPWGTPAGQGMMRIIAALLLMSSTAMAQVQNKTYQDSMGRNTGRSVTSGGTTTVYDQMGWQA